MQEQITIPHEVLNAFYQDDQLAVQQLDGGIVNKTFAVSEPDTRRSILQRIHSVIGAGQADDYDVLSQHLYDDGWEVATARKANTGQIFFADREGRRWRSFTYIESDGNVPPFDQDVAIAFGGLLGILHTSLSKLDYKPTYSLPHFHDTAWFAAKLESLIPDIGDKTARKLADTMIRQSATNPIAAESSQLIHGDPKLTNALYREGRPFTYIDFDTVMHANPLVDVGDMLRSMVGKYAQASVTPKESITDVIRAYYETAKPRTSEAVFQANALAAARQLALELGMRYLIDSVENSYFDWDNTLFPSRFEHNVSRAQAQMVTFDTLT